MLLDRLVIVLVERDKATRLQYVAGGFYTHHRVAPSIVYAVIAGRSRAYDLIAMDAAGANVQLHRNRPISCDRFRPCSRWRTPGLPRAIH